MRKTIVTAVASLTFLLAFSLMGCSNEGAHDSGVREIKDRSRYENVVELGPISARYADDTIGVILAGYFQSEYERDPASWDDVLCTLSVK